MLRMRTVKSVRFLKIKDPPSLSNLAGRIKAEYLGPLTSKRYPEWLLCSHPVTILRQKLSLIGSLKAYSRKVPQKLPYLSTKNKIR